MLEGIQFPYSHLAEVNLHVLNGPSLFNEILRESFCTDFNQQREVEMLNTSQLFLSGLTFYFGIMVPADSLRNFVKAAITYKSEANNSLARSFSDGCDYVASSVHVFWFISL